MPTQLTLVSLYGDKNKAFSAAITQWQELVTQAVGSAFTPYDHAQIHATIIGLERHHAPAYNSNFSKYRAQDTAMDFAGCLTYLRACCHIPFAVQVGGFAQRDYPFTSREARPYERSFSVQGRNVVVMGWPIRGEPLLAPPATPAAATLEARLYPPTLDIVRHAMQAFGILHAYHRAAIDVDNDLFFRIGLIDQEATTPAAASALEIQARGLLSAERPLVIEICLEDICVAAYDDDTLPMSSTRTWALTDQDMTSQFVTGLFT